MIPPFIALIGACLVTLGTREALVHMPMGDTSLADASSLIAWLTRLGSVAVLVLVGLRSRKLGWLAWFIVVGALAYEGYELNSQLAELKKMPLKRATRTSSAPWRRPSPRRASSLVPSTSQADWCCCCSR